jgi:hypothetical protein
MVIASDETLCGISSLMVLCPYAGGIDMCFYPSNNGPCRHGIDGRRAAAAKWECKGTSAYATSATRHATKEIPTHEII